MRLFDLWRKKKPSQASYSQNILFSSPIALSAENSSDQDSLFTGNDFHKENSPLTRIQQGPVTQLKRLRKKRNLLVLNLFMSLNILRSLGFFNFRQDIPYLETKTHASVDDILELLKLPEDSIRDLGLEYSDLPLGNNNIFDPRISPALALFLTRKNVDDYGSLDPNFKLHFLWEDWCNIDKRLTPSRSWLIHNQKPLTCSSFKKSIDDTFYSPLTLHTCEDLSDRDIWSSENKDTLPKFKVTSFTDLRLPIEKRVIYGAAYVKYTMDAPKRLIMLGVHPSGESVSIQLEKFDKDEDEFRMNSKQGLIDQYLTECRLNSFGRDTTHTISVKDETKKLAVKFSKSSEVKTTSEKDIIKEKTRVISLEVINNEITHASLEWNLSKFLDELKIKIRSFYDERKSESMKDWLDYRLYRTIVEANKTYDGSYPKYFHEARTLTNKGDHFDWRFFNANNLTVYERRSALHKMAKAWLRFSKAVNIQTWLAHGTLLGYSYNGMSLNWDTDLDVQVSMESLVKLARNYNQSLIVDTTIQKTGNLLSDTGLGAYFLDVGTYFFSREYGNGNNAIDARFIDIHTGLYIDITALSTTDQLEKLTKKRENEEFGIMAKANNLSDETLDPSALYHCKNKHYYTLNDLSPIKKTSFESVEAYIPFKFDQILRREYPNALSSPVYAKHTFRSNLRLWIPFSDCPKEDYAGELCRNQKTLVEFGLTKKFTEQHAKELEYLRDNSNTDLTPEEFPVLHIDEWLLRFSREKLKR